MDIEVVSSSPEMESKWLKEVKDFDESKIGVKGLLDSGLTTIPRIFHHPPEALSDLKPSSTHFEIPLIDLSISERSILVDQVRDAFSTWGFFQVVNHGIPIQVIEDTIKAFKSFHEEAMEVKRSKYVWDEKVSYSSTVNLLLQVKAMNWKDSLRVSTSPNPPAMDRIPSVCRKELMEWDDHMKKLSESLMELICEGLGVDTYRLKELDCMEGRKLLCHYYPYCPQPDLTFGLPTHTDRSVLTLLLQNEVTALQVKYGDQWVEIKPIHGGIIVNAGDLLQILSNDKLQSVEHRVVANPCKEPRVSITVLFNPGRECEPDSYGPFQELLSQEHPALYRNFSFAEFHQHLKSNNVGIRPSVKLFKLNGTANKLKPPAY